MFSNRSIGTCPSPTAQYLAFTFTPRQLNQTQSRNGLTLGLLLTVSTYLI